MVMWLFALVVITVVLWCALIGMLVLLVDIVTCMALDKAGAGDYLITGSRDTTCVVWKFGNSVS